MQKINQISTTARNGLYDITRQIFQEGKIIGGEHKIAFYKYAS